MKNLKGISIAVPSLPLRGLIGSLFLMAFSLETLAQNPVQDRTAAFEMNDRLGNGIVFGSNMWIDNSQFYYARRDFQLARLNDFNHTRICARVQNMVPVNPNTNRPWPNANIDAQTMNRLFRLVQWSLDNDMIAVICPFFWWKQELAGEPEPFSNGDIPTLAQMWGQIAAAAVARGYTQDEVVFELYEEPEININVDDLIEQCVDAIRAANSDHFIVIPGRGFNTITGMGRVFDGDRLTNNIHYDGESHIPVDDAGLIATFHFYEPKCLFTNIYHESCTEGNPWTNLLRPWPQTGNNAIYTEEALRDWFEALDQRNTWWAGRNGTRKLPVYMGEYGTINRPNADPDFPNRINLNRDQRKHWVWWTRTVAEEFGYSTAYWNAYGVASFGLGDWNQDNPSLRNFGVQPGDRAFIRHAILGRYEAEDLNVVASLFDLVTGSDSQTSHSYVSFRNTPQNSSALLRFREVYVGKGGTYNVTIRFANAHSSQVNLAIRSRPVGLPAATILPSVPFAVTGAGNYYSKTIPMYLEQGLNNIQFSGAFQEDLRIDFIAVTHEDKTYLDQYYDFAGIDDRF